MVGELGVLLEGHTGFDDSGLHVGQEDTDLRIANVLLGRKGSVDRHGVRFFGRNKASAVGWTLIFRHLTRTSGCWLSDHLVHVMFPLKVGRRVIRALLELARDESISIKFGEGDSSCKSFDVLDGSKRSSDPATPASTTSPSIGTKPVGSWTRMPVIMHEECASVGDKGWVFIAPLLVFVMLLATVRISVLSSRRRRADNDGARWLRRSRSNIVEVDVLYRSRCIRYSQAVKHHVRVGNAFGRGIGSSF